MKVDMGIAELKAENDVLRSQNTELQNLNQWLLDQLKLARKRQFGPSSEQHPLEGGEQLGLFDEAEATANAEPEEKEVKAYVRRKTGSVGTGKLPEDLPVEVVVHDIADAEKVCAECGNAMHVMGRE